MKPSKSLTSHRMYSRYGLCAALLLLTSYTTGNDNVNNSLEDQIAAAQRSAEELRTQLNPSDSTPAQQKPSAPDLTGEKMKGMGNQKHNGKSMGGMMKQERKPKMAIMKAPMERPMGCQRCRRMMGMMKAASEDKRDSSLPAFPGNQHLYHIGSDNFFLNQAETIRLTESQRQQLTEMQRNWQVTDDQYSQNIDLAEQKLWQLTGEDAPDIQKIETKIREIEEIKTQQRLAFIQAIGEAATILTVEQRRSLTQSDTQPQSMRQQ
ncbi:MAG: hypothetical protein OQJ91_07075 [Motiliproteus sp.]|nr:hypothetical protein [Motiliproteus sp.]